MGKNMTNEEVNTTIKQILNYKYHHGFDFRLKYLQNRIIKEGNPNLIFSFAQIDGADVLALEQAIIDSGDAEYIYKFACVIEGADIRKLEDAIIETGDFYYITLFAMAVPSANVKRLEDSVVRSKDIKAIINFARKVKRANVERLEDIVIESKNAKLIYNFAVSVENSNREKMENAFYELNDGFYLRLLREESVKEVPQDKTFKANIQKFVDVINQEVENNKF